LVDGTVREDMTEVYTAVHQHFADEQPAVTLMRLALSAQQRQSMLQAAGQDTPYRRLERGLLFHAVISSMVMVVVVVSP
jgi:hypothetical protein